MCLLLRLLVAVTRARLFRLRHRGRLRVELGGQAEPVGLDGFQRLRLRPVPVAA